MFIMEGLCLGVIGVVIGNVIGMAIIFILNVSGWVTFDFGRQTGLVLSPTLDPMNMLVISAIVIFVSVVASLQPAFKASRMEPIKALRHV
jgi:putative ABC transport system permease protein